MPATPKRGLKAISRDEVQAALRDAEALFFKLEGMFAAFPKPVVKEHPEDRASRLQAERAAARNIERFLRTRRKRLVAALQTYADAKGHEVLEQLREEFWGDSKWTQ